MLGLPLELVHRWWRIMLIYLTGVLAGSLTVAVADPHVYLAGASGGVYALIAAHLANVIFNWREMEFPALRLLGFLLVTGVDTGVAVYYRYDIYPGLSLVELLHYCPLIGQELRGILLAPRWFFMA